MSLFDWLCLPGAIGLFLLPGWWARRHAPDGAKGLVMITSALAFWWVLIIALDLLGWPLDRRSIWTAILLPLIASWWRERPTWRDLRKVFDLSDSGSRWWWALASVALISVLARGVIDPLSGWDTAWRWNDLAERITTQGSLAGYPPVSPGDFERYGWPDGIPPLASVVAGWFYVLFGHSAPELIVARLVIEVMGIALAVRLLATRLWAPAAGGPAIALAGTSSLLLWGINMGQETGLMTLGVAAVFALLPITATDKRAAIAAGIAAGIAASSREYGLAYAGLGAGLLLVAPATRRNGFWFSLVVLVVAGPWYARNLWLTGNPLVTQSLGGLFPVPLAYERIMGATREFWAWGAAAPSAWTWVRLVLYGGGFALLCALANGAGRRPWSRLATGVVLGVLTCIALWWWSTPFTAGGRAYALRVLSPAAALLAVMGAGLFTTSLTAFSRRLLLVALVVFTFDAARRSWLLPVRGADAIWHYSWQPWAELDAFFDTIAAEENNNSIATRARGRLAVFDDVRLQRRVRLGGQGATSLMDPRLQVAFDDDTTFATQVDALRAADVGVLVLTVRDPLCARYFAEVTFFRELRDTYRPNEIVAEREVYDLDDLIPNAP